MVAGIRDNGSPSSPNGFKFRILYAPTGFPFIRIEVLSERVQKFLIKGIACLDVKLGFLKKPLYMILNFSVNCGPVNSPFIGKSF